MARRTRIPSSAQAQNLLKANPAPADALFQAAIAAHQAGRFAEAEAGYRQVLSKDGRHADALHLLGVLHQQTGRPAEAEALIRKALAFKEEALFLANLAGLLKDGKRAAEAEAAYRRALALKPGYVDAHYKLGNLLAEGRRPDEAEAVYRRVLELQPDCAEVHNTLGILLKNSRRLDEAEAAYRRALALKPDYAEAWNNLGNLLQNRGRPAESESAYRRALALKPDYPNARFNLGFLLLALQRYPEAWPLYESRYAPGNGQANTTMPGLAYPQWQGEPLAGKSLVIWPEQGLGDYIQFARYAPLLKARGVARLTLACPSPLAALLETVDGVDAVVTDPAKVPAHDYWCFVLSLPLHFATTADTIGEAPVPYVKALPSRAAQWRDRLPAAAPRVGLAWKGSAHHKSDAHRSLPGLASLAPLWSAPGITFVSLQKGPGEEEALLPPAGQPLVALGDKVRDFADSAAIVSQLDLVICVDTALAHLAGALGKPCWVLLPAMNTDWRWLLEGTESPWYPGMRLFRQTGSAGWDRTVHEVAAALTAWVQSRP